MKFKVTFKDPDAVYDALYKAAKDDLDSNSTLEDDEKETLFQSRLEKLEKKTNKWLMYGEYMTVEFDTDANTCTVLKVNEV